jgi:hypothetical protein
VTLRLIDQDTAAFGWGGLGIGKKRWLTGERAEYARVAWHALVIAALLLLPGLCWNAIAPGTLPITLVPLPGIVGLAIFGLGFWQLPAGSAPFLRMGMYVTFALAAVATLWKYASNKRKTERSWSSNARLASVASILLLLQAAAIGMNPLPIAQEYGADSAFPGRMVASPPDHGIPYQTAAYFFHHHDGHEKREQYFGEWSLSSRGPLVPLGITALMYALDARPEDPPLTTRPHWPLTGTGIDIARSYGWMLNALLPLGALHFLLALGVNAKVQRRAIVWVAVCPLAMIGTVFLWPKLLAAYFLLLAVGDITALRMRRAGFFAALAWLSHPVGALMLPAVGLFALLQGRKHARESGMLGAAVRFSFCIALTMAPWLVFKWLLGQPDAFLAYVLADGNGMRHATSLGSWLHTRWSNLYMTLSPLSFFFSDAMTGWIYGPLSDGPRWTIGYAKTLPGQLGLSAFVFAYLAMFRRQLGDSAAPLARVALVGVGLLTMLLFWGYSSDGLGRNSLEALTPIVIVLACATWPTDGRWIGWMLAAVAAESAWIGVSGFVLTTNGLPDRIPTESWVGWATTVVVPFGIVFLGRSREHAVPIPSSADRPTTVAR